MADLVGRNVGIDAVRRQMRQQAMPPDDLISDLDDAEAAIAERLDSEQYRDDVLRLLFICTPELPTTQQIALALRIVCGLSVGQIARAFLVSESAMEQRITRAKARIGQADIPSASRPARRAGGKAFGGRGDDLLTFNEGYSATGEAAHAAATALPTRRSSQPGCSAVPSRARGHGACRSHAAVRGLGRGLPRMARSVLLEDQDRRLWIAP